MRAHGSAGLGTATRGGKNRRATRLACTRAYRLLTRDIASRKETIDAVVIEFRKEKFQTRVRTVVNHSRIIVSRIFLLSFSIGTTRILVTNIAYVGEF